MINEELRFPIGQFETPNDITGKMLSKWISDISTFPTRLKEAIASLTDIQLDTPYRPGGWTIRQVVHHCADSHMNSLTRFKLTLTENRPTIKPYDEARWAELPDSKNARIEPALNMLEGLHERWTLLLHKLTAKDLEKIFIHPEQGREYRISENIGLYAWHCNHHLAHITTLKEREGWR